MLHYGVSNVSFADKQSHDGWWQRLRPRLAMLYLAVTLVLLIISGAGHLRLLAEVGKTFGGFTWGIDPDSQDSINVIAIPPELPPFGLSADSLSSNARITAVNNVKTPAGLLQAYQRARPGEIIRYTAEQNSSSVRTYVRPAVTFTLDMWWQTFGMTFLAGASWLFVGAFLLWTAPEWTGAVEGITLLPPAMLLLLYSHWGNIQQLSSPDLVVQLLWIPAFALLGAAFIHLSLIYHPDVLRGRNRPTMKIDMLPYLPLLGLLGFEWISLLLLGHVPLRINVIISLAYATVGGVVSFCIGITSLVRIARPKVWGKRRQGEDIPLHIRHRIGDLLTLWIGGVGLGFCLGVLPILLIGQTLLPLPIFFTLATVYPLILLYAIRSLRLINRLHITLDQREEAFIELQRTTQQLQQTNIDLKQATSLLLHADAHLRSLLSQRLHDQPKQQALRIRSLLGHWQNKLRLEAERDVEKKVNAQPVVEALAKVRKISEELESDLRGLQLLVEDAYQRRSLGLKLHLEKLIREDLPMLHPEAQLRIQADLWALDVLTPDLEQTPEGERIAEAISYAVTQALLNVYNHAGATFVAIRTRYEYDQLSIEITDDGRGFDTTAIPPEKTSLFKAQLKTRAAGGVLQLQSRPRPQAGHGTTVQLLLPISASQRSENNNSSTLSSMKEASL